MNSTLNKIKNISADYCVTIIMNTHRTKPDYLKDEVTLKNHIRTVEKRLDSEADNKTRQKILNQLNNLAEDIDHSHNLDSLILFANPDVAEFTRLALEVKDRVVIDDNFATRDLIRAMHLETNYYILVLSQEKARLIEAMNGEVVKEFSDDFPMETVLSHARYPGEHDSDSYQTNLIDEFLNRVDKQVQKVWNKNPLSILIASVDENYHRYVNVSDDKRGLMDIHLNGQRMEHDAERLVAEAWTMVKDYAREQNNQRKSELKKAVSDSQFLSDNDDIWRAIHDGRIKTLFIEQGLFQPAEIKGRHISLVPEDQRNNSDVIDDIYDEMIEANRAYGGEVVFLPPNELKEFNGFGAVTRY